MSDAHPPRRRWVVLIQVFDRGRPPGGGAWNFRLHGTQYYSPRAKSLCLREDASLFDLFNRVLPFDGWDSITTYGTPSFGWRRHTSTGFGLSEERSKSLVDAIGQELLDPRYDFIEPVRFYLATNLPLPDLRGRYHDLWEPIGARRPFRSV